MMRSCSCWMVATMSFIRPVRLSSSAAKSVASAVSEEEGRSPRAAVTSRTSSSTAFTVRATVRMCRRFSTPSGEAAVAV